MHCESRRSVIQHFVNWTVPVRRQASRKPQTTPNTCRVIVHDAQRLGLVDVHLLRTFVSAGIPALIRHARRDAALSTN